MNGDVWRSREAEILAKYAERLRPAEDAESEDEDQAKQEAPSTQRRTVSKGQDDEIDFRYMNGPPPKDLLNYKNMEIEMSLWAKTGTGWMSVGVLLVLMVACVIVVSLAWMMRGTLY